MKEIKTNKILSLFKDHTFLKEVPVCITKLPIEVFDELIHFTEECRKRKNHNLSFLFEHYNKGLNTYQISVPKPDVERSFIMPYLISLGQFYLYSVQNIPFDESHRNVLLRENVNHYDGYDLWINYTEKGDENPNHTHAGAFSGVIYLKNTETIPTIFNQKVKFFGSPGTIVIFPSDLEHSVEKQTDDFERITMSFNLYTKKA